METLEQVAPLYLGDGLIKPDYQLYRIDQRGSRHYYCPQTDRYYISATSFGSKVLPTPTELIEWFKINGLDSDRLRDMAADYGTFFHIEGSKLMATGEYDLDAISKVLQGYDTPFDSSAWTHKFQKHILSLEAFRREKQANPVAIEIALKSDELGIAGTLDYVGPILFRSKLHMSIVDYKTGKNFFKSHEFQLKIYEHLWNENYPDMPIEMIFNMRPTEWRNEPKYELKNQTTSKEGLKIPSLLEAYRIDAKDPSPRLVVTGKITPDTPLEECYSFRSIKDEVGQ